MSSDTLFESVSDIAGRLHELNRQAVREYTPIVEGILRSRSRDADHIEHTLDGLVSFCGYAPALVLYKKLCRHFWEIDPTATAWHIHAYRDMWDEEDAVEPGKVAPNSPDGGLTK